MSAVSFVRFVSHFCPVYESEYSISPFALNRLTNLTKLTDILINPYLQVADLTKPVIGCKKLHIQLSQLKLWNARDSGNFSCLRSSYT